jgi:parvulin-like peptidyl-prolyl isomerase
MVAVKTQIVLNELYGPTGLNTQITNLQKQDAVQTEDIAKDQSQITTLNSEIAKAAAGSSQLSMYQSQLNAAEKALSAAQKEDSSLQSQISDIQTNQLPLVQQDFTQSQIGNDSVHWLQDDELIREWLSTQSLALQNKISPTTKQVNDAFTTLKKQMPTSNGYNTMFSTMGISDDQIRSMLTIIERRDNMQSYLAPLLKSPSYQVMASQIVLPTQAKANTILKDLQKGQDFGKLAKANSTDTTTASNGGSLGWLTRYQYIDDAGNINGASAIDDWLFSSSRKLNEISPVIYANSAYYIVKITNIDPSRAVSSTLLQSLQADALVNWLQDQGGNGLPLPGQNITAVNQTMLLDAENLPPNNLLPSSAPAEPTPTATEDTSGATPAAGTTPGATATPTSGS